AAARQGTATAPWRRRRSPGPPAARGAHQARRAREGDSRGAGQAPGRQAAQARQELRRAREGGVRRMSAAGTVGAPCCIVVDDLSGTHVAIEGAEAEHVRKALRVKPGEHVSATDGNGMRATLEISRFHKHVVEARVVSKRLEPRPARRLWLARAADGPRFAWLVEKPVELGAFGVLALEPASGRKPRTERWERVARAALGQSLGSWGLRLESTPGAQAAIAAGEPGLGDWASVQVADPDGESGEGAGRGVQAQGA